MLISSPNRVVVAVLVRRAAALARGTCVDVDARQGPPESRGPTRAPGVPLVTEIVNV